MSRVETAETTAPDAVAAADAAPGAPGAVEGITADRPDGVGAGAPGRRGARLDVAALELLLARSVEFAPSRLMTLDRGEAFPAGACRVLDGAGLQRWYVPARFGGSLDDYGTLLGLLRTVAAHDLSVAVAHAKTFLGGACVWTAGSAPQADAAAVDAARALARQIEAGTVVAWGLTEPDRGADLLAGELVADRVAGGYRLTGVKWPVNNASRADIVTVLARTGQPGDPRGYSVLVVDTREVRSGAVRRLPKERTHGIRGADISGIAFDGVEVAAECLVGGEGAGLELVLASLQFTRLVCAGLSLGAADHALRLAEEFADERVLYGRTVASLPHARRTLGELRGGRALAEAVALFTARAAHTLTGELSVYSAVAKALVPTLVDEVVEKAGELLGARAFLTVEHADGAFQKLERDHRIVGIFDGSTFVNRHALIRQFPRLAAAAAPEGRDEAGVRAAAGLGAPLPEPGPVSLVSRTGCSLLRSLPEAVAALCAGTAEGPGEVLAAGAPAAAAMARQVLAHAERLLRELAELGPQRGEVEPELFALAERYEVCVAAAAAIRLHVDGGWADGRVLAGALAAAVVRLEPAGTGAAPSAAGLVGAVFDDLGLDRAPAPAAAGPRVLVAASARAGEEAR
ncbi:acyl-CoA dehydrogenase family protein [Actinacidiphila yeochonensis]|uniref:acyl-CoA dehydrogenase family protein n=1 Tax=Actinacidiphila yeochonensis TaxID=89050 RepID=UPI00068922D9|nr:acyl-CoA dehydrogenase [Actinacidiphila yeochonensis]